jgi:hypothetical protein
MASIKQIARLVTSATTVVVRVLETASELQVLRSEGDMIFLPRLVVRDLFDGIVFDDRDAVACAFCKSIRQSWPIITKVLVTPVC